VFGKLLVSPWLPISNGYRRYRWHHGLRMRSLAALAPAISYFVPHLALAPIRCRSNLEEHQNTQVLLEPDAPSCLPRPQPWLAHTISVSMRQFDVLGSWCELRHGLLISQLPNGLPTLVASPKKCFQPPTEPILPDHDDHHVRELHLSHLMIHQYKNRMQMQVRIHRELGKQRYPVPNCSIRFPKSRGSSIFRLPGQELLVALLEPMNPVPAIRNTKETRF
jgi:hypothetical protein